MPKHRAVGAFARATQESLKRFEVLQGLTVLYIQEQFSTEDDPQLELEGLTWDKFIKELESAQENETTDEFNKTIARLLEPVMEQVFNPQEEV